MGRRHTKTHCGCRRCGRVTFHMQRQECASCGYPRAGMRRCELAVCRVWMREGGVLLYAAAAAAPAALGG